MMMMMMMTTTVSTMMIMTILLLAKTHIFYPFAIEIAGTWHDLALELTQEIDRRIITPEHHSCSNSRP